MPLSRAIAAPASRGSGEASPPAPGAALSIGLSAVIVAASVQEPRVLTIRLPNRGQDGMSVEALPSGPLEAEHRTLEIGLRTWVERQTSQRLGYVEQLYTFGDRDRGGGDGSRVAPGPARWRSALEPGQPRPRVRPSGGCAPSGSASPSVCRAARGTRSWCSNAT